LDEAQGTSEKQSEVYLNTLNEHLSWQRSDSPEVAGRVAGFASKQTSHGV